MNYNTSKLFDELIEAWNNHDLEKALTYYDENIKWRDYSFPEPFLGIEGAKRFFNIWNTAFPDFRIKVLTKLVGEDIVAMEMEFSGTHSGSLHLPDMDLPPTNKKIVVRDANFSKFKNGKLIEVSDYPDVQGMMVQLGIQPVHAEQSSF